MKRPLLTIGILIAGIDLFQGRLHVRVPYLAIQTLPEISSTL
jgi:hypothetical protein